MCPKVFLPKRGNFSGIFNYYRTIGRHSEIFNETSSSSYDPLHPPSCIFDGNVASEFWSESSENYGQWFTLGFPQMDVLISDYTIYSQTGINCYPKFWNFSISNDNIQWHYVHEIESDILEPNNSVVFHLDHPIVGRYFRWTNKEISGCNDNTINRFYINEVEIFGNIAPFLNIKCSIPLKQPKLIPFIMLMYS